MAQKKILLIVGGMWHDFESFANMLTNFGKSSEWLVESTQDYSRLLRLNRDGIHTVVSYTCLSKHRPGENDTTPDRLSDNQIDALEQWVLQGGGLLSVHSGTVLGESNPRLGRLLGGEFVSHPPQFEFTVYPLAHSHPIIAGIEAFTIQDEFYIQKYDPDVLIHMVAIHEGKVYPMVWSKEVGKGKVAHIAPGHAENVWNHPVYQKLLDQTLDWLGTPLSLPGFIENSIAERPE